ncbi:MAG: methionyl-tRNA formyltransferase [bacterium]|nr:methionyl-tRNA formyltransferase [bacterium]
MRLVFLGTPAAAVPSLKSVLSTGHELPLVVCQPDRPVGRSGKPRHPAVKQAALEHDIEVFQPRKVRNAAFRERLAAARPDVLVVVAYGRILTNPVLELAPHGAINVHFSLLPRYRGAAPVQWALARGERETGVTTMRIAEELDAGDMLLQESTPIEADEHAPALGRRLADLGGDLLLRTLAELEAGRLVARPQDHAAATLAPLLDRADGNVDPALPALEIAGRVRGFDPWPGVWLRAGTARLRLREAREIDGGTEEPPGTLLELAADGLVMAAGGGSRLLIRTVQAEGRRAVAARDAVNGRLLTPGDRLERCGDGG